MAQHDYTIANQGFPATRADINNAFSAIATNNSGTSAPSTQYAGQFWIDTTSSTWTLYIHDGADDIQFATIDTSANTVNFTDSALDVVTDTTPQLGGDLDLNSNDITGTGDINITGDITASGSLLLGTALAVAEGGTGLTSGFANGITEADQWRLTANITANTNPISANLERVDNTGFGKIGTGMSVSSGIWTFPSTGVWKIEVNMTGSLGASDAVTYIELQQVISGTSTSVSVATIGSNSDYDSASGCFLYNVTDTSTHKFSFKSLSMVGTTIFGDTDINNTYFTFIRLGDSV